MQRWIKKTGAVLLLAGGVVYGTGLALPIDHTATLTTTVSADLETVWAALTNVQQFPEWRPGVDEVEIVVLDGRPGWKESGAAGEVTFAIAEVEPLSRMVTRLADEGAAVAGSWTWQLVPDGDGTVVRVTEAGEIRSPLVRFFTRYVVGYDATVEEYVEALSGRVAT